MKQTRRFLMPVEGWDPGAMEEWLVYQAARGWMPVSFGVWYAKFRRSQPRTCRVRLEPLREEDNQAQAARKELYEDLGWTSPADMTDYRVWYCADPDAPELYTDPESLFWAWKKQLCRDRWNAGGTLVLLGIQMLAAMAVLMWSAGGNWVDLLVHYLDLPWLFVLAAVPFFLCMMALRLRGTIRTGRRLKRDGTLPHTGPWRKNRRRTALLVGGTWIFLVMLVLAVLLPKVTARSIDLDAPGEPLPCVSLSALDAAAGSAAERSFAQTKSSFLAPEYVQIMESAGEVRVVTNFDRLRFASLARALYGEQLEDARKSNPRGAWSVLDRPGFDRLALMTEEDRSILVACRDRTVLYVYADGIDDLSAHLDDYAAILEEFQ
ncbi:DUF2812 domain-containing protein [Dysosmobacter sp.]|uniref:DUF2812 domain-containing protein n=1 Tax=Dysosmobacter sp. TaxID=2591382 RepID=UPI002A9676BB|nr:DUF2812 domain-containing protein [Dysosmobacter sp.]MCI6054579.1 DUF2812 domain-containing protein [Dysosmobacter sp.]MDY5510199.1 DUF2812 domain-containing protein [Dysosmobacter sp.]